MKEDFKKPNLFFPCGAALLIIVLGYLSTANAQIVSEKLPNREGVKVGNILLHTALTTQLDFDSNIHLAEEDEKYDTIVQSNPSIGVEVAFGDNLLSSEYDTGISSFIRFPEQSHIDHRFRSLLELNFTDFNVNLSEMYRRYTTRAGQDETGSSGRRQRRAGNDVLLSVISELDQLEYALTYENKISQYLVKNNTLSTIKGVRLNYDDKNFTINALGAEVGYRAWPKTTLLFEVDGGLINYYSDLVPDSNYVEALAGIKGEWFGKLVFNVKAGGRYQDYKSSHIIDDEDFTEVVARGAIDYNATEDDIISLNLKRDYVDSIYSNQSHYELNFVSLDYTHKFTQKITGNAFFFWQRNIYPKDTTENGLTAKRVDNFYSPGLLLRYDIHEWISVEADYVFSVRDSRFRKFDYESHIGSLRATVGF